MDKVTGLQNFINVYAIYHNFYAEPPERFQNFSKNVAINLAREGNEETKEFLEVLEKLEVTSLETFVDEYVKTHKLESIAKEQED